MDCALALALADAAPLFRAARVTGLSFSAAYDYRTVRGGTQLSEHAHGLAIDVHAFETTTGRLDVQRDFLRDPGRTLHMLTSGLQRHPSFRLILTPDDNQDHYNHFHIESRAYGASTLLADRGHRSRAHATAAAKRSESGRAIRRRNSARHHHHSGRR
jgi:hypothetical protein